MYSYFNSIFFNYSTNILCCVLISCLLKSTVLKFSSIFIKFPNNVSFFVPKKPLKAFHSSILMNLQNEKYFTFVLKLFRLQKSELELFVSKTKNLEILKFPLKRELLDIRAKINSLVLNKVFNGQLFF